MKRLLKKRITGTIHPGHTKGCLYGKSPIQKHYFFKSLIGFAKSDPEFFKEQVADLLPGEAIEFYEWVERRNYLLNKMKGMLDFIEVLIRQTRENLNTK